MSTKPSMEWPDPPAWQQRAACRTTRDPEKWFPDRNEPVEPAKTVCRRCPVRNECRRYALANKLVHGIWGGLDEYERRDLAAERNAVMVDLDPQILGVLPAAERLVQAVHNLDPDATTEVLAETADELQALAITLAAMLPADTDLVRRLEWLPNPDEYQRLRDAGVPPGTAAVLAKQPPTPETPDATVLEVPRAS